MRSAMKKLFSLILVAVLLISVFPMPTFAAAVGGNNWWENQGGNNWWENQDNNNPGGNNWWENQDGNNWWENQDGNNWWPTPSQPGDGENQEEEPAPTTLKVNFLVDGTPVENYTVSAETTVQDLINNYCIYDKNHQVNYGGAKIGGNDVALDTTVKLGEEVDIYLTTPAPQPTPDPQPTPETCSVCDGEALNGECLGCHLNVADCQCNNQPAAPENHWGEIKVTPKFRNDYGMFYDGEPVYVKMGSTMRDVFAKVAIPAAYQFDYWSWDMLGNEAIGESEQVPFSYNIVIFAQYAKDVQADRGFNIYVNLNHSWLMGDTLERVAFGTFMKDALKHIPDPTRWGYRFDGWYWDAACTDDVAWNDVVYQNCTIYAKWVPYHREIMLKIYVNGNFASVAKIVDLHDYAQDGWITMDEVKQIVQKYYTSKNSNGLAYFGLFDSNNWHSYVYNHLHPGANAIPVDMFGDTTVHVMVHNAKTYSTSSSTADVTNPKTGDTIGMAITMMAVSAAALAAVYVTSKKRAV